jgi:predicted nuclease of predicted toxin-antitoxin system
MKFLVDAQLPRRIIIWLRNAGFEAIHTLDLPRGNQTPDEIINELSIKEGYVVITKDADFVNSFLIQHKPHKLFLISTGNITNKDLETLLQKNMIGIANLFKSHDFIEINKNSIVIHT